MEKREELWKEAKKRCRLNEKDVEMAKKLGLNPRSLIKNIPNKNEKWKKPVKIWIHEMYDKSVKKSKQRQERKERQKRQGEAV